MTRCGIHAGETFGRCPRCQEVYSGIRDGFGEPDRPKNYAATQAARNAGMLKKKRKPTTAQMFGVFGHMVKKVKT